jgi:hypothetical protein
VLQLARACGLHASASRIERIGHRDALLVRRFDRQWRGTGYARSRMVSALTLLRADDHVTDRRRWSYLALADEIRRASSKPREDLHELFARMCFNAAVSNLDDHPRNHAVLAQGRQWRLSPAYDLTPAPVVARERRDLAMVIEARFEEIFELVEKEIKRSGYAGLLRAGSVITGGSSQLPGYRDLASRILNAPVRLAYPEKITGIADTLKNPSYSTSVGLLRLGLEMDAMIEPEVVDTMGIPVNQWGRRMNEILRRFLPQDD